MKQRVLPCQEIQCRVKSRKSKRNDVSNKRLDHGTVDRGGIFREFIHSVNHLYNKAAAFDPKRKCRCCDFNGCIDQCCKRYDEDKQQHTDGSDIQACIWGSINHQSDSHDQLPYRVDLKCFRYHVKQRIDRTGQVFVKITLTDDKISYAPQIVRQKVVKSFRYLREAVNKHNLFKRKAGKVRYL